jgi:hypothetical protein
VFSYRPPKGSCWGHAIRAANLDQAKQKLQAFFDRYFDPPEPQEVADPWDFAWDMKWKEGILPHVAWLEWFLKPGRESAQRSTFFVTLGAGSRISFPMGITFPLSPNEPSSYEFLKQFNADAPFKMSAKHFSIGILRGKKGNLAWRKVEGEILAKLQEAMS